jgi:hypothetical protein
MISRELNADYTDVAFIVFFQFLGRLLTPSKSHQQNQHNENFHDFHSKLYADVFKICNGFKYENFLAGVLAWFMSFKCQFSSIFCFTKMNDQLVWFMMKFPMIFMVFMKEENALKFLEWNSENDAIAVINTYLSYWNMEEHQK